MTGCPPKPPDPARTGILAMLRQTNEPRPMRKIEQQMNDAIIKKVDFKSANTEVIYYSGNDISDVYLHGNLIARVYAH